MTELYRHIGANCDVPAGDLGVGAKEVGYLFGQYKRIKDQYEGVLTGKGLSFGGSLARTEATGYGLCYFSNAALKALRNDSLKGKRVIISGAGNVATHALEKALQLGAHVIAMSDIDGWIYNENGIDIKVIKEITGLGLKESKDIADNGGAVKENISVDEANEIKAKLEEAGAEVEVK